VDSQHLPTGSNASVTPATISTTAASRSNPTRVHRSDQLMAHRQAGTAAAAVHDADRRTPRLRKCLRARAQTRLPVEIRQQFLEAIYAGQPFRTVLRELNLTPNQVWGLTKTDGEWAAALEAALTITRRDDLEHGTNAAYVAGCVCKDCREHQRIRMMARNRRTPH